MITPTMPLFTICKIPTLSLMLLFSTLLFPLQVHASPKLSKEALLFENYQFKESQKMCATSYIATYDAYSLEYERQLKCIKRKLERETNALGALVSRVGGTFKISNPKKRRRMPNFKILALPRSCWCQSQALNLMNAFKKHRRRMLDNMDAWNAHQETILRRRDKNSPFNQYMRNRGR